MTVVRNTGFGWIRSVYDILFDAEIRSFSQARRRNPDDPDLPLRLGEIYLNRYHENPSAYFWIRAVFYFEKVEKMEVWSGVCMTTLVADRLARGKADLALKTAKDGVERMLSLFYRRSQSGEAMAELNSMAQAFLFLKHVSAKFEQFEEAVVLIPENIQMQIASDTRIKSKPFCLPDGDKIRIENRVYSRFASSLTVDVHLPLDADGNPASSNKMSAAVIDLSEGGVRFLGRIKVDAGDKLSMAFYSTAGGVSIKLSGTACWVVRDPDQSKDDAYIPLQVVGVEFSGFSKESRKALSTSLGSERA